MQSPKTFHTNPPKIPHWICGDYYGAFPKGQIYGSLCFNCAKDSIGASFQLGEINISLRDMLNRIFADERYSPTSRPKYINTSSGANPDPDSDDELDLSLMAVCRASVLTAPKPVPTVCSSLVRSAYQFRTCCTRFIWAAISFPPALSGLDLKRGVLALRSKNPGTICQPLPPQVLVLWKRGLLARTT